MTANLLEKARANRLIALEVLKQRDSNLFLLADARKTARRRQKELIFTSRRSAKPQAASALTQAA